MPTVIFVLLLCLLSIEPLHAQNPPAGQRDPFSGQAAFGYLAMSGNTDSTSANASLGLLYHRAAWSHELDLSAVSATSAQATIAQAYSATYESRRAYGERAYLFMALDWQQDRFSAYDRQVSESIGYGRRLLDRERHVLNAEVG